MKWILVGLLLANSLWAETSQIIPVFIEASKIYLSSDAKAQNFLFIRPDIRAALEILSKSEIDPSILEKRLLNMPKSLGLREDDEFDQWIMNPQKIMLETPELAVHALKFKVIEESDDWFNDDIYMYFFVTDGVIPTGKVTSIYKGVGHGQSFFFDEIDRAIFPLLGVSAKRPENHLIIDYGIMESDGDDIKELHKLSGIIIDIALAVYAAQDSQHAETVVNLRKEIKALAQMLLSTDSDDRLASGSLGYKVLELEQLLKDKSYTEVTQKHKGGGDLNRWKYQLTFRFLRN
jgi:hypothetical protein